jgi:hypothetical protein
MVELAFFKNWQYIVKMRNKKWKPEKSDFGDFPIVRSEVKKKGVKIVRFIYVVFIV